MKHIKDNYVEVKDMKVGDKYFFVNDDLKYGNITLPTITRETIYRIVGDMFSTRETGDMYEVIRHYAYKDEKSAKQKAIKTLLEYKDYMNKKIDMVIKTIKE